MNTTGTSTPDYTYDVIGNLIGDQAEGIQMDWNMAGKVRGIEKDDGTTIHYQYDALGKGGEASGRRAAGYRYYLVCAGCHRQCTGDLPGQHLA